jgi:hypothetical protein
MALVRGEASPPAIRSRRKAAAAWMLEVCQLTRSTVTHPSGRLGRAGPSGGDRSKRFRAKSTYPSISLVWLATNSRSSQAECLVRLDQFNIDSVARQPSQDGEGPTSWLPDERLLTDVPGTKPIDTRDHGSPGRDVRDRQAWASAADIPPLGLPRDPEWWHMR